MTVLAVLRLKEKDANVQIDLSGTYDMSIILEKAITPDETAWEKVMPRGNGVYDIPNATISDVYRTRKYNERLRLRVLEDRSGSVDFDLSDISG